MTLKEQILLTEGRVLNNSKPAITEHIDWLKKTLEAVEKIDSECQVIINNLETKDITIKSQFMWDNQKDSYKWYDIEVIIKHKSAEEKTYLEKEINKQLSPVKKYLSDITFEDGQIDMWFVIK